MVVLQQQDHTRAGERYSPFNNLLKKHKQTNTWHFWRTNFTQTPCWLPNEATACLHAQTKQTAQHWSLLSALPWWIQRHWITLLPVFYSSYLRTLMSTSPISELHKQTLSRSSLSKVCKESLCEHTCLFLCQNSVCNLTDILNLNPVSLCGERPVRTWVLGVIICIITHPHKG